MEEFFGLVRAVLATRWRDRGRKHERTAKSGRSEQNVQPACGQTDVSDCQDLISTPCCPEEVHVVHLRRCREIKQSDTGTHIPGQYAVLSPLPHKGGRVELLTGLQNGARVLWDP